jgi:ketosteroid isomerase-like protein
MNKTITKGFVLAILMLSIAFTSANAQSDSAKQPHYKDFVGENADADADIKLVSDYVHKLVAGDVDKATAMLASNYKGYGPGPGDSATAQMVAEGWKHSDSVQLNRKDEFVAATFNVKSGDLAGHWVEMWGTYSFTENGKDVKFPYQYSAHLKNGKIDRDYIYYDKLYVLTALGYTVTPPAK